MRKIVLFKDVLPAPLFRRLVRAVRAVGAERLNGNQSYSTTFWFPVGRKPTNVVEEVIVRLRPLVRPGPKCVGMEWWLGRLKHGRPLSLHIDRDLSLEERTGRIVHPVWSSVLYLNRVSSSPTLILDQVLGPDGQSLVPPEATFGRMIDAVPNDYVIFRGNLRHGVVVRPARRKSTNRIAARRKPRDLRLTLLVNYWEQRPMPPICRDYDGSIYGPLGNA